MTNDAEIEKKFWKALRSDRTIMIGLTADGAGLGQPMTAQIEDDDRGPIYIFTSKDTDFVRQMTGRDRAIAHFASKGHDVFANLGGLLSTVDDAAIVDRLWNPFVAAWYKGGKSDPLLQLLRFDADDAQIWLNENSIFAGIRMMLGVDPKQDVTDKTAHVHLS